ncbi:MAG TPA: M56 family metallopeptidase, partial [Chitinophagaceae bacterium]
MIPLLFYSGAVIICSGLFYGYYCLWLRNNRFHHWNRYYLLAAVLGSLFIPLLNIPVMPGPAAADTAILQYTARLSVVKAHWLAPVTISAQKGLDFTAIVSILYLLVLILLLGRLFTGYARMLRLIRKSETKLTGSHYKLIATEDERGPYSFFNFIFWNGFIPVDSPAGQQMLQHELLHIREKHSVDKMLMEIIASVCWINPFFYLIKKELELVHEFSADEKAASLDDETHAYAELLLMKTLGTRQHAFPASLTNNFFHPPIKRRLQMLIRKNNGRLSWLKKAGILPVALCTFIFFGCQNNTKEVMAK